MKSVRDDVVVLGAGHNGLVCACYLAMAGLQVRILERRNTVGGACVTEEFCPGFRNSTASYTVGLLDSQIIRELKLFEHGLRIVPRPLANFFLCQMKRLCRSSTTQKTPKKNLHDFRRTTL